MAERRAEYVEEIVVNDPAIPPRTETIVEDVVDPGVPRRRVIRAADGSVAEVVERVPTTTRTVDVVAPTPRRSVRRWWRRDVPAVTDVVSTEYYTAPRLSTYDGLARALRIAWFLLGLFEGLLALRFLLALMGANPANAFAASIYGITGPLVAPFRTLFAVPAADGSVFETYTLIAMLVYALAWWVTVRLIGVITDRPVDTL